MSEIYPSLPAQFKKILEHTGTAQKEIAELVCDELFEFFSPKVFTEPMPDSLRAYRQKSYETRTDFERKYPNWKKDNGIEDWEKRMRACELENLSNIHWLKEWAEILKGTPREKKLRELIELYTPPVPQEALAVANEFKGRVINRKDWDESES